LSGEDRKDRRERKIGEDTIISVDLGDREGYLF